MSLCDHVLVMMMMMVVVVVMMSRWAQASSQLTMIAQGSRSGAGGGA